jgi:methylmalonyl-CoA mutase N-terminal domain/subunit
VEAGERIVVGVNRFTDDQAVSPPLQRIDPESEAAQAARVQRLRAERDPIAWARAIQALDERAASTENLLPAIIDAVKARATLGEISDRLRVAFGEHRELITV